MAYKNPCWNQIYRLSLIFRQDRVTTLDPVDELGLCMVGVLKLGWCAAAAVGAL